MARDAELVPCDFVAAAVLDAVVSTPNEATTAAIATTKVVYMSREWILASPPPAFMRTGTEGSGLVCARAPGPEPRVMKLIAASSSLRFVRIEWIPSPVRKVTEGS